MWMADWKIGRGGRQRSKDEKKPSINPCKGQMWVADRQGRQQAAGAKIKKKPRAQRNKIKKAWHIIKYIEDKTEQNRTPWCQKSQKEFCLPFLFEREISEASCGGGKEKGRQAEKVKQGTFAP
jgi:hypothetical protein